MKRIIVGKTPLDIGEKTTADLHCGHSEVQVLRQVYDHGTSQPYGYEIKVIKVITPKTSYRRVATKGERIL